MNAGSAPSLLSVHSYHYRRGGAEIAYLEHAALMERHGWRNTFFSMHHEKNLSDKDSEYFAEEINYGKSAGALTKINHALRIIYSREARSKLSRLLDTRRIDIAHVHNIYHHQSPSILIELKKRGIPTVLTAHDLKLACPAYLMLNSKGICEDCKSGRTWNVVKHRCIKNSFAASALVMLESSIHKALDIYARNVNVILAPSAFLRTKLIEWGFDAKQIVHIPNFVPDRSGIVPKTGGAYVLYFGRLSKEKGLSTLIRASALSQVPVWIAGTGPQEEELKELVSKLEAPVEFKGYQTGEALWAIVDGAKATVLPSECYENGPLSALEALQRGKPLIGAAIGGITELVTQGQTGWYFKPGDAVGLADVLAEVHSKSDSELRDMGASCQRHVSQHYSEASYFGAMMALYGSMM